MRYSAVCQLVHFPPRPDAPAPCGNPAHYRVTCRYEWGVFDMDMCRHHALDHLLFGAVAAAFDIRTGATR
jgi:hypothetical protein